MTAKYISDNMLASKFHSRMGEGERQFTHFTSVSQRPPKMEQTCILCDQPFRAAEEIKEHKSSFWCEIILSSTGDGES